MNVQSTLGEGFGFNTDLFDTNIINLVVVLAAVFYGATTVFAAVLEVRRNRIRTNISSLSRTIAKNWQERREVSKFALNELENIREQFHSYETRANSIKSEYRQTRRVAMLDAFVQTRVESIYSAERRSMANFHYTLINKACDEAFKNITAILAQSAQKDYYGYQGLIYKLGIPEGGRGFMGQEESKSEEAPASEGSDENAS